MRFEYNDEHMYHIFNLPMVNYVDHCFTISVKQSHQCDVPILCVQVYDAIYLSIAIETDEAGRQMCAGCASLTLIERH